LVDLDRTGAGARTGAAFTSRTP